MTVTTTHTVVSYSGDAATTAFAITFQFFASSDITPTITDDSGNDVTSGYSFAYSGGTDSDGLPATGSVTITPAPAASTTVSLRRITAAVQSTVYAEGTSFPAKTVEALADRSVLLVQEANYASSLVSFDVSGDWATATAYSEGDLVQNNGSSYIALSDHTSAATSEPGVGATWTTFWVLFAAKGDPAYSWQSQWLTSTAYAVSDAVYNDGSSYICTVAHTSAAGTEPGTGGSWGTVWDIFASEGATGPGTGDLLAANNLSALTATAATARSNISAQQQDAGLDDIAGLAVTDGNVIVGDGANWVAESGATARTSLGAQAQGDVLDDLNTLGAPTTDGEFIVATGAGAFAYETGATARSSIGLGTTDAVTFDGATLNSPLFIGEQAAADADVAADGQVWVKNTTPNELWFTTDAGDDIQLTSGTETAGGGGPSLGVESMFRTNKKSIGASVTVRDHASTFSVDTGAETLSVGTDQGFANGDSVYVTTTGTLPAPLAVSTEYYVVGVAAATMQLATTYGGSAINITTAGSGTHTVYEAINASSVGPVTVQTGATVTVSEGSTWTVV
jgi:hypothetical protein